MNNNLIILGAGEYGMLAKEIAEETSLFGKIDFLDDKSDVAIGGFCDCERLIGDYKYAFVALGNPKIKLELLEKLNRLGYKINPIISPMAYVSKSAIIGDGTIIEPMATVQTGCVIGIGAIISSGAVIRHNATVGNGAHCDCNCVVLSNAVVPEKEKIFVGKVYGI